MNQDNKGLTYALTAYLIWGSFALFFHLLRHIPSAEVLAHRIIWSFVLVAVILSLKSNWHAVLRALRDRSLLLRLIASSLLIAINWLVYIWAVSQGRIIDSSLGYFINPLVSVLLATMFLKESLSRAQLIAVVLALVGVIYQVLVSGSLPWIALVLAFSFGTYGLIRKQTAVDTVTGLMVETLVLLPLALGYWLWLLGTDTNHFDAAANGLLLIAAGIMTAVPLLAFAAAAKHLSLTVLGFMIYIAPSLQFLSGVFILGDELSTQRLISFCFIWLALIIFSVDTIRRVRKQT
ncbi:EamA family transporter RarD [Marinobacterium jannaschii]|uniref:EamA family transporter RarD n=1 Tax=Marinobacterium jannaschii TaxID=64970 RepID=UPI00048372D1|nr:EamA family transporter RarD [Marinobacterium jannaschii]